MSARYCDHHANFDFLGGHVLIVTKEKSLLERFLKSRLDPFALETMRIQELGWVSEHWGLQPKPLGESFIAEFLKFGDGAIDAPVHLEQSQSDDAACRARSASKHINAINPKGG